MRKLTTFFKELSIARRILIGFALILLVQLLYILYSLDTVNTFYNRFAAFKQVSADSNLMLEIDKNISELQRYILIINDTQNTSSIDELENIYLEIVGSINVISLKGDKLITPEQKQLLDNFKRKITAFKETITSIDKQLADRNLFVDDKLSLLFQSVKSAIANSYINSEAIDNKKLLSELLSAQMAISNTEVLSGRYLDKHEYQVKKQVLDSFTAADQFLASAEDLSASENLKKDLAKTRDALTQTKKGFQQALQYDRDYLFLNNIVIAGKTAEFRILADQLKTALLKEQTNLFSWTEQKISLNKQVTILIGIVSIALGFLIAYLTGQSISNPLTLITNTFNSLSKGNHIDEIPGIEKRDEIGQLARAANVFRQSNLNTQQLLKESEMMTQHLKQREQELQSRNDELDNFTYVVSHDLQSPLGAITNLSQWIKEDLGDDLPEDVQHHLDRMQQRVGLIEGLVKDLLLYSRSGKISDTLEMIDTAEMIEEILSLVNIPETFKVNVDCKIPSFETAATPLKAALRNIISNAYKHHDLAEGNIDISVSEGEEFYEFTISDDGPGIPEFARQRIFILFQTLEKNTDSSGLGLAFAKRMIEAHGGEIKLASKPDERGSSFVIKWLKDIKI